MSRTSLPAVQPRKGGRGCAPAVVLIGVLFAFTPPALPQTFRAREIVPAPVETLRSHKEDPDLTGRARGVVALKSGTFPILVRFEPGSERAAEYMVKKTAAYLPLLEEYLARPLRPPATGFVIHGRGAIISGYDDINVDTKGALESPALLFHELGHLWFPGMAGVPEWFSQSVVSYLPLALHEAGIQRLNPRELAGVYSGWAFHQTEFPVDFPLAEFRKHYQLRDAARTLYDKGFKVQYLLHFELGQKGYRDFLRGLFGGRGTDENALLVALGGAKERNWRNFLSGWVHPGPYLELRPASFADSDLDGLIDVAERYLGTSPEKADTDGDGYADGWEVQSGHDPLKASSPGPLARPVVDGVRDPADSGSVAHSDPRKDAIGRMDITEAQVIQNRGRGARVFLRANFQAPERRWLFHTVHLRRPDGQNYWLQTWPGAGGAFAISEFKDGEPFEQWRPSKVPLSAVAMAYADVFEAEWDPVAFGLQSDDYQVNYIAGGSQGEGTVWNSDTIGPLWLQKPGAPFVLEGSLDLAPAGAATAVMEDPEGDVKGDHDRYDIRRFTIIRTTEYLYTFADFHNEIRDNVDRFITYHLFHTGARRNFWIQFRGAALVGLSVFSDGTPFEKWTSLPLNGPEARGIRQARGTGVELVLPLVPLRLGSAQGWALVAKFGAMEKGKENWNADESAAVPVPELK